MTDDLLKKLEEKMMTLLAELETMRRETHRLRQENQDLKMEYGDHVKKLQGLVSLLDSLGTAHEQVVYS
ncbi:MAG TPA: hypothetical protein VLJ15_08745 [Gammaproteobacteria bacterium]|nr:hypothetical protein [Gammaproteobacteria bacterium]